MILQVHRPLLACCMWQCCLTKKGQHKHAWEKSDLARSNGCPGSHTDHPGPSSSWTACAAQQHWQTLGWPCASPAAAASASSPGLTQQQQAPWHPSELPQWLPWQLSRHLSLFHLLRLLCPDLLRQSLLLWHVCHLMLLLQLLIPLLIPRAPSLQGGSCSPLRPHHR